MSFDPEDLRRAVERRRKEERESGVLEPTAEDWDLATAIQQRVAAGKATERWRKTHSVFVSPIQRFDPDRYAVEVMHRDDAKPFVIKHHYEGSVGTIRVAVGLFEVGKGLVGVALFGVPPRAGVAKYTSAREGYSPIPQHQGVELNRFVLLDEVPYVAETWFLSRAFELLVEHKPDIRMVLSYSDPLPRRRVSGEVVMPGHLGIIYQSFNARFVGRTRKSKVIYDAQGRTISARLISKIRGGWERGGIGGYGEERLLSMGAPRRHRGESPEAWVRRSLRELHIVEVRHPGKYVYLWAVGAGRAARKTVRRRFPEALPYPGDPQIKRKARQERKKRYGGG